MTNFSEMLLNTLLDSVKSTAELADMMMCSRTESYRRFRNDLRGCIHPEKRIREKNNLHAKRQNFFNMLNYLKREGFIIRGGGKEGTFWAITKAGVKKINAIKQRMLNSRKNINYERKKTGKTVIFAFDIPEKLRKHRAWLREVLKYLGFTVVQKSLWIGTKKIPEEFLSDLQGRGIIDHVDIFEVGSKGTLRRLDLEKRK